MLLRLVKDRLFLLALLAALVFWCALYFYHSGFINPMWPLAKPLPFILLALIYPILEEIVFRGFIQGWLTGRLANNPSWYGVSLANIITSMLFVGLHFWQHPPLWALAVLLPSLVFGFFRDRYTSVTPAILLHCFYNLGYFWLFANNIS